MKLAAAVFRRLRIFTPLVLLVLCLAAHPTQPASKADDPLPVDIDIAKTTVGFTLHAVLHTVHGTFKLRSSTFGMNRATGRADGVIAADASSGNTGDPWRDEKMNRDILESAKFPLVTFGPERVDGIVSSQGMSRVTITGVLTLHGARHEVSAPVEVNMNGDRFSADMKFDVPYVKWGLRNPSTFVLRVNDTVQIEIHAVGSFGAPGSLPAGTSPSNPSN